MNVTDGILCSKSHEWLLENDGIYTIGLTDYAVEQLGDIVFVELPDVGSRFSKLEAFATVESVKAASEIYMPVSGKVVEINEDIIKKPELINESPFELGWLIKVECDSIQEDSADLMEYDDYKEEIS